MTIREAEPGDLDALEALEIANFETDRLSRRRLRHWIRAENRIFLVAEPDGQLRGYALALFHGTTRLARLYSIAVAASARGQGIARQLLQTLEERAAERGRFFMRLEVAQDNQEAIRLYESAGYAAFDTVPDYYEDHRTALRMQKIIRQVHEPAHRQAVPWYQQTTEFTCGPAALMMAMSALDAELPPRQSLELELWREATTIFMTSGHGGTHPMGLALAAHRRGFAVETFINRKGALFTEGVRQSAKKHILTLVHRQFLDGMKETGLPIRYRDVTQQEIEQCLAQGGLVVVLISSYRLDRKKAPHWVTITAADEECFYVNDPDPSIEEQTGLDCEDLPIDRRDFEHMSQFGRQKLRAALLITKPRGLPSSGAPGSPAGVRTRP
jgi:ribosomal protein S18 acetylase RimI-like enzyme